MTRVHLVRPTAPELGAGVLLAVLALWELFTSAADEHAQQPWRVAGVVAACLSLGWLRSAPLAAVAAYCLLLTGDSLVGRPTELLGMGLGTLAAAFGLGAFGGRRAWAAGGAFFALAWLSRDVLSGAYGVGDAAVDLVLTSAVFGMGVLVHRRSRRVAELSDEVGAVEARAAQAAEAAVALERGRIARELHDIVAHAVSVMVVQAGTARPRAQRLAPELDAVLAAVEETGREALVELRRLLDVLRQEAPDVTVDDEPVPGAPDLPQLAERMRATGLDVDLAQDGDPRLVDAGLGLAVYRVAQEGLTNALRHGGQRARLAVRYSAAEVVVEVTSDLAGDRVGSMVAGSGAGTGLLGVRERVELFGGQLRAGPTGAGWELVATLPLMKARERSASGTAARARQ